MSPPLIGITSYGRDDRDPQAFPLPCAYVEAVRAVGGVPLILPPGEGEIATLLAPLDGLILSGGGDISPGAYGGKPHETMYMVSDERDAFEIALTREALGHRDLPLLFVCRGMQLLNVVCGGTLLSHLPERYGDRTLHRLPPRRITRHTVRIAENSRLVRLLAAATVEVCSWHHQAVDQLGNQLTPVAWAPDGVLEALEHTAHPWCFAVQWHPEMQHDEPAHAALFKALVDAATHRHELERGFSAASPATPDPREP